MKRSGLFISIGLFVCVLFFFTLRQSAIFRANKVMAPAIERGWTNFETTFVIEPGIGPKFTWWVRYEQRGTPYFSHPLAVYVPLIGEIDDWEVRRMLAEYKAAEQGEALKP